MLATNSPAATATDLAASICRACNGEGKLLAEHCALCDGIGSLSDDEATEEPGMLSELPRVGRVRGGGRPRFLRHMPGQTVSVGFEQNHPICGKCRSPARPAILMFGDWHWKDVEHQEKRWRAWTRAVRQEIASRSDPVRVVILELGAGKNVPTVRCTSEDQLNDWHNAGADVCLVRVNPDLPLGDSPATRSGGKYERSVISIMARGLPSLQKINTILSDVIGRCIPFVEEVVPNAIAEIAADVPDNCDEGISGDRWERIETAFAATAQGETVIPLKRTYDVIFNEAEKIDYGDEVFFADFKGFRKLRGDCDVTLDTSISLKEIRLFLETMC